MILHSGLKPHAQQRVCRRFVPQAWQPWQVVNRLYYGDNLDVLRNNITDESVDLVYLAGKRPKLPSTINPYMKATRAKAEPQEGLF